MRTRKIRITFQWKYEISTKTCLRVWWRWSYFWWLWWWWWW